MDLHSILTSDSSEDVNIKLSEFKDQLRWNSDIENLWIQQVESDRLYFSYTNPEVFDGILVFEMDNKKMFHSIVTNLDESVSIDINFEASKVFSNHQLDFNEAKWSKKVFKIDRDFYIADDIRLDQGFSYLIYKNISREINFIIGDMIKFASIILIYIILMMIGVFKASTSLLGPLNRLTKAVTSVADKKVVAIDVTEGVNEFSELFNLFNEMVEIAYQNIASIEDQSEIINDKNKIVSDLNHQLSISAEMIEASTRELRIFEKQSKTLVDNIKDLMWVVDAKGRIIYVNSIVEDKLGFTVDELLGVKLENLLKQNVENEEALQDMFVGDYEDFDLVFLKKNSESEEIFSTSSKRIFQNDKLIKIQGVSRDITEERFIEVQMVQKNEISNTLNEISEILTRPEKLEVLLDHIVIRIERLLDPLVCTIRLLDEKNRMELKAGIGECYSLVQEKYLDIDNDISGRAIKEGKIIIMSDRNRDYYDNYDEVFTIIDRSKELIFLPLEYDDGIIGVMSIGLREKISDAQLKILKVFTNQASAAIEKARMYEELENNYLNIIKALASTVEAKDSYTEDHSIRVSLYARLIAEELGMSEEEIGYIDIAGLLHDIGKIGVSDLTLTKEGKLTDAEFLEIKKHPLNGGRIVSEMKLHDHIVEGVLLHHKRFDLKGYPDVYVESLPISARIIGVADAFDAMTSNRSYQKARSFNEAYEELVANSGSQFCPEIVGIMGNVIKILNHHES